LGFAVVPVEVSDQLTAFSSGGGGAISEVAARDLEKGWARLPPVLKIMPSCCSEVTTLLFKHVFACQYAAWSVRGQLSKTLAEAGAETVVFQNSL
jgi:hypothetical protein